MTVARDCPDCGDPLIGTADDGFTCIQCGWSGDADDAPEPTGTPLDVDADASGRVRLDCPDPRRHMDNNTARMSPDAARRLAEALEVAADDAERREERNGEPMTDGGEDREKVPIPEWELKARENVQKWGLQPVDALLLAMGEEMGELAGEVHGMADYPEPEGDGQRMAEQGRDLIRRMDALGRDIRDYLETVSERDGEPVPEDERPDYLDPFPEDLKRSRRERLIRSELDDLMALGYQFLWALEAPPEDPEVRADGGQEIPDDHRITAKTHGEAELETLPDPDDAYPSLDWNYGASSPHHFQCSCGEPLDDSARSVVNHLIEVGAYEGEPMTDGGRRTARDRGRTHGHRVAGRGSRSGRAGPSRGTARGVHHRA